MVVKAVEGIGFRIVTALDMRGKGKRNQRFLDLSVLLR